MSSEGLSYAAAGVDIEAYERALERVKPLLAATHGKEVVEGVGPFAGLYALPGGGHLAASADGVGTKIKVAIAASSRWATTTWQGSSSALSSRVPSATRSSLATCSSDYHPAASTPTATLSCARCSRTCHWATFSRSLADRSVRWSSSRTGPISTI